MFGFIISCPFSLFKFPFRKSMVSRSLYLSVRSGWSYIKTSKCFYNIIICIDSTNLIMKNTFKTSPSKWWAQMHHCLSKPLPMARNNWFDGRLSFIKYVWSFLVFYKSTTDRHASNRSYLTVMPVLHVQQFATKLNVTACFWCVLSLPGFICTVCFCFTTHIFNPG